METVAGTGLEAHSSVAARPAGTKHAAPSAQPVSRRDRRFAPFGSVQSITGIPLTRAIGMRVSAVRGTTRRGARTGVPIVEVGVGASSDTSGAGSTRGWDVGPLSAGAQPSTTDITAAVAVCRAWRDQCDLVMVGTRFESDDTPYI